MDIAKIKASLLNFDPTLLRDNFRIYLNVILKTSKNLDLKYLTIGITIITIIYMLIFIYVYISGAFVIAKMESKLASEIIPVTFIQKQVSHQNIDIDNKTSIETILIDGLYEETKDGMLPIIRSTDNLTSFKAYQLPFTFPSKINKPVISFIIKDYGLSKELSKTALDLLPPEVSFMLTPYSDMPNEWIKLAQDKGHEIWIDLPIQNKKVTNFGKNTIFHHASIRKKQNAMRRTMARSAGYTGVSAYTDSSMNIASDDYLKLADEIYARGLGYFEMNPNAPKTIENKAINLFSPHIKADLEIFRIKGDKNSFETLEKIAKKQGHAIAVIPSYPNTIKNLAVWILKAGQSDYIITPISAIYDLPLHKSTNNNTSTPHKLHNNDLETPTEKHH